MMTEVNQAKCPKCGRDLPQGGIAGLCPACLLEAGGDTKTAVVAGHKRFQPPSLEELSKLFPQLKVLQLLGAGGMGAVYKARQPSLDRFVALKILPPGHHEGINFAERFNREARALARLSHPSIVAVHEFGNADGLHYFIMEYVDGANLRQLQQSARLSPREAMQIIPQICDALQYAHDEGVVHRDIKPENILVDRRGRVKIADFGLAKVLGIDPEQARLTAEGQVMGTPHYMAPEQLERPLAVDHRADIYSLGVVFYEMLTGDLPLGKFAPPSRKVSVDVRLDEVVLRALENDPERRYQHASQVKTEVETISAAAPAAPPAPAAEAAPRTGVERYIRWAGIPLARERDGEREITWSGGSSAFLIGLLLTSGGMLLTRLATGSPEPSLLGIPSLIIIFTVGAGLRWALNVPLDNAREEVREDGTVVVDPSGRKFNLTYLAFGSILLAVFAWGVFRNVGLPAIRQKLSGRQVQVAKVDSAARIPAADLPGIGRIELLGVGYQDSAPNQWWRPDGTVLTNEYFILENQGRMFSKGMTNCDLAFRLELPAGASGPQFEITPNRGSSGGGVVLKNGSLLPGGTALRAALNPGQKHMDVRVGVGLGEWRTIATREVARQSSTYERKPGDPHWETTFHSVSDTAEGAQVTVVMNADKADWTRRVVAIDTNGVEHPYVAGSGTPAGPSSTWTYTFRKLPLNTVKEFRVQVQPLHWVEFRKVRLLPEGPLPPAKPVVFEPTREISFSDFIDFDTGKIMQEPAVPAQNIFDGMNETVAWMQRNGLDAAAGIGNLQPLGMTFAALSKEDWDTLTPGELVTKLHHGLFIPAKLEPWPKGELPSTFAFRTREGGTGILQLVGFAEERPEAAIRYKLLRRPVPPTAR